MSASPSFPLNNDQSDRPISVYDNLTTTPSQITNGHRENPKAANGDPLKNITFKFDYGYSNGKSSSPPLHSNTHVPESNRTTIKLDDNARQNKIRTSSSLISTPAPEVNCNVGVKIAASQGSPSPMIPKATTTPPSDLTKLTPDRDASSGQLASSSANKLSPRSPAFSVMSELARNDRYGSAASVTTMPSVLIQKPVISDAKSKFFGLNNSDLKGASGDERGGGESVITQLNDTDDEHDHQTIPLLSSNVQPIVVSTSGGPDQRYQNIPSNSAIFRKPAVLIEPNGPRDMTMDTAAVTNDLQSAIAEEKASTENPKMNFNMDTDSRNDRRRNTNSFHADMDLNYSQQQPSQIIYMTTTVPQNIKSPNIAGRHTPTRNSLRHSRMLVVNKTYQGLGQTNPLGLKHPKIARLLLMLLLILGILITAVGIWILLWAPYTRMQDNPYWSGLSLILAGTLGLIVIKFKRIKRHKMREHCFTFLKVDSLMLTLIACILCLAAFSCASIHLHNLYSSNTKCASANIFIVNASCICIFGAQDRNFTLPNENVMDNRTDNVFSGGYEFYYRDLSCNEVNGAWRYLLIGSVVLNVLGFFLGSCYLLLACFPRTDKRKTYNSVRTNVF